MLTTKEKARGNPGLLRFRIAAAYTHATAGRGDGMGPWPAARQIGSSDIFGVKCR